MKKDPLSEREIRLLQTVFSRHPEVRDVTLFGSRAKGTHARNSDIDLSVRGKHEDLRTETLAMELDELPLPYRFDVLDFNRIQSEPLREHIERVGIVIYPTPRDLIIHQRRRADEVPVKALPAGKSLRASDARRSRASKCPSRRRRFPTGPFRFPPRSAGGGYQNSGALIERPS